MDVRRIGEDVGGPGDVAQEVQGCGDRFRSRKVGHQGRGEEGLGGEFQDLGRVCLVVGLDLACGRRGRQD